MQITKQNQNEQKKMKKLDSHIEKKKEQKEEQYLDQEFQFIDIDDIKQDDKKQKQNNAQKLITLNTDNDNDNSKNENSQNLKINTNVNKNWTESNVNIKNDENDLNHISKIQKINQQQQILQVSNYKNQQQINHFDLQTNTNIDIEKITASNIKKQVEDNVPKTALQVNVTRSSQRFQRLQRPKRTEQRNLQIQKSQIQSGLTLNQSQQSKQKSQEHRQQGSLAQIKEQQKIKQKKQFQSQRQEISQNQIKQEQKQKQKQKQNPIVEKESTNLLKSKGQSLQNQLQQQQISVGKQKQQMQNQTNKIQDLLQKGQNQQQIYIKNQKQKQKNQRMNENQNQNRSSNNSQNNAFLGIQIKKKSLKSVQLQKQEQDLKIVSQQFQKFVNQQSQSNQLLVESNKKQNINVLESFRLKRTDSEERNQKKEQIIDSNHNNSNISNVSKVNKLNQYDDEQVQEVTFTRSKMLQTAKRKKTEQEQNQQAFNIQKAFQQANSMRQSSSNSNVRMSMQKLKSSQSQITFKKPELPQHLNFKTKFTIIEQALTQDEFNNFETIQRNLKSQLCENQSHKFFVKYAAYKSWIQTKDKMKRIVLYAQPLLKEFDFQKILKQNLPLVKKLHIVKGLFQCVQLCHKNQYMIFPKDMNEFLCLKQKEILYQKQQNQGKKIQQVRTKDNQIRIKFMTHLLEPIGDILSSKHIEKDFIKKIVQSQKIKNSQLKQLVPEIRFYKILENILLKKGEPQKNQQKKQSNWRGKESQINLKDQQKQKQKQRKLAQIYQKICHQSKNILKIDIFCIGLWMLYFLLSNKSNPNNNVKRNIIQMIKKNYEIIQLYHQNDKKQNKQKKDGITVSNKEDKKQKSKVVGNLTNKNTKDPIVKDSKNKQKQLSTSATKNKNEIAQQQKQKQIQPRNANNNNPNNQLFSVNFAVLAINSKQIIQTLKLDSTKNKFQIEVLNLINTNMLSIFPQKRAQLHLTIKKLQEIINKMHGEFTQEVFVKVKERYTHEIGKIQYIQNFDRMFKQELQLLNNDYKQKINELIKKNQNRNVKGFKFIYKASHFHFKAKFFHQYCYQKSHLLVVIQPKGDKKLFCYSQQAFDLKKCNGIFGNYIKDLKEFSFIYNGEEYLKLKNKDKAISICASYGPIFGDGDIVIGDGNFHNYSQYPKSYQINKRKKLFKTDKFQLQEYDIYEIQF